MASEILFLVICQMKLGEGALQGPSKPQRFLSPGALFLTEGSANRMEIKKLLVDLAKQAMQQRGLQPEFSESALDQLSTIDDPPLSTHHRDMRSLPWCSIDNNNSRDLDQLTYAEKKDGRITIWVAISDVDAVIAKDSPIDRHAQINTTSVYTPAKLFPMLPEKLSTNLTSLNEGQDRLAIVVEIQITNEGEIENSSIYQAIVHNHAKLNYNEVGGWLERKTPPLDKFKEIFNLEKALDAQRAAAKILKQSRQLSGSLNLKSPESEIKITETEDVYIEPRVHNLAHQLIEEFMIAANKEIAKLFRRSNIPSLFRIVRTPKYWNEIRDLAKTYNFDLPESPNSKLLNAFLNSRQEKDPENFQDLSLTVIKLLGRGEYVVENYDSIAIGHFALALPGYTHSTAPNRRFPDLISQRQYKAFLQGKKSPYNLEELHFLAAHCTKQEDNASKVERQINKSAAAAVLSTQIGSFFKGIVISASGKGTWVRLFHPPVEGKIVSSKEKLKAGDHVSVELIAVDIQKGFIDFIVD